MDIADLRKCDTCGGVHPKLTFAVGDRVKALSMMPHILKNNPFGDVHPDRTGHLGVVVRAWEFDRIGTTGYLVNFNPDPAGPWLQAPFNECQLELAT